jgi:hypothetical protein
VQGEGIEEAKVRRSAHSGQVRLGCDGAMCGARLVISPYTSGPFDIAQCSVLSSDPYALRNKGLVPLMTSTGQTGRGR